MTVIEFIRQATARAPNAVALRTAHGCVSYAALMQRVDGLARALCERGIGPNCRVAVLLDRSPELIVALLATLATGAAYVPLDPELPAVRLAAILRDSASGLLLGRDDVATLSTATGLARFDPQDWPSSGAAVERHQRGPAYVIYTSGSTGGPKGVVIEHDSLTNYLAWCRSRLPFTGGGAPLFASIAFDHSVTCVYPPLMSGEPLTLLPPIQGGRALAAGLLTEHRYSFVKITPSHFGFLDAEQRARLGRSTDLLMFGGERIAPDMVAHARRDNPTLEVMNHYGPTEATVGCCVYRVPVPAPAGAIPIGKPIDQVLASIRREDGTETEPNELGELWIGGAALAAGYWQRPDLTARAFVEPTTPENGPSRWYRTGDAVRRRTDGILEYVSRLDDQVKILGYRVEPREVEQVLKSLPGVTNAAVLASGSGDERNRLIAAVVVSNPLLTEETLRHAAREHLPGPMVPERVLCLNRLPVMQNGKLDRRAILELAARPAALDASLESLLGARFSLALGLPQVEPHEDFFELGGDSMATVEIAAWVGERFRVPLEPTALFEHPSVHALARHIRALSAPPTTSLLSEGAAAKQSTSPTFALGNGRAP
jgi:amino acid adenylation domain-containing protein